MSDDNASDYAGPPHNLPAIPQAPRAGTLPPAAKTWNVIFAGLERVGKELGLPVLILLAAKWDILSRDQAGWLLASAIGTVLGGNFALRKAETKEDK